MRAKLPGARNPANRPGGYNDRAGRLSRERLRPRELARLDAQLYRCGGCGGWRALTGSTCSTCDQLAAAIA